MMSPILPVGRRRLLVVIFEKLDQMCVLNQVPISPLICRVLLLISGPARSSLRAKRRMGLTNTTDKLDARGLAISLRNGTLPEVWIRECSSLVLYSLRRRDRGILDSSYTRGNRRAYGALRAE